jgi:hypothetical protein
MRKHRNGVQCVCAPMQASRKERSPYTHAYLQILDTDRHRQHRVPHIRRKRARVGQRRLHLRVLIQRTNAGKEAGDGDRQIVEIRNAQRHQLLVRIDQGRVIGRRRCHIGFRENRALRSMRDDSSIVDIQETR